MEEERDDGHHSLQDAPQADPGGGLVNGLAMHVLHAAKEHLLALEIVHSVGEINDGVLDRINMLDLGRARAVRREEVEGYRLASPAAAGVMKASLDSSSLSSSVLKMTLSCSLVRLEHSPGLVSDAYINVKGPTGRHLELYRDGLSHLHRLGITLLLIAFEVNNQASGDLEECSSQ